MPIVQAIRDKIAGDPSIATRLGKFDQGDAANAPAIFTGPRDLNAPTPCVEITLDGGSPEEDWDERGAVQVLTISVYGSQDGSFRNARKIAQDIQWLLDRATITVTGFTDVICRANVPTYIEDDWPRFDLTAEVSAFKED